MAEPRLVESYAQRSAQKSESYLQRDNRFESSSEKAVGESLGNILDTAEEWSGKDSLMAARLFIDGLWLNKADEIGSWVAATAIKATGAPGSDRPIPEIRKEMLTQLNAEQAQFYQERPVAAITANVVGGLLSPVSLKGGQLLSRAKDVRSSALAAGAADEAASTLSSIGRISPSAIVPLQSASASGAAAGAATVAGLRATGQGASAVGGGGASLAQQLSGFSPRAYSILGKTPTPLLAAGAAGVEAGIIGAEGNTAEEIAKNALSSAALGAGFSTLISGGGMAVNAAIRSKTTQELGHGTDFISLMFTDHALAPVYKHVVSKAMGASSFLETQARLVSSKIPSLNTMKERGINLIANSEARIAQAQRIIASTEEAAVKGAEKLSADLKEELTANKKIDFNLLDTDSQKRISSLNAETAESVTQIKTAAAREAEVAANTVEAAFRSTAFQDSLPSAAPAHLAQDIQAMAPREALEAVRNAWESYGYRAAKESRIPVNRASLKKELEVIIKSAPEYALINGSSGLGMASRMGAYVDAIIAKELGNKASGLVSGQALVQIRSDIGRVINDMSQGSTSAKAIVKPLQQHIDNLIERHLTGDAAAEFKNESNLWRIKSHLEDASELAISKEGAFSGEDWVKAAAGQSMRTATVGKGILQQQAEQSAKLRNASNETLMGAAKANIRDIELKKDQIVLEAQASLRAQKAEAARQYRLALIAVDDAFEVSKKSASEVAIKQAEKAALREKFNLQMRDFDGQLKSLTVADAKLKELMPSGSNTIFQSLFASGLLASAFSIGMGAPAIAVIGGGYAAAGLLSAPSVQRALAGQTGAQKSASAVVDAMQGVLNRVEAKYGMSTTRAVAIGGGRPGREGVIFDDATKAAIRSMSPARRADLFRGLQQSGKIDALRAEDFSFYQELQSASGR